MNDLIKLIKRAQGNLTQNEFSKKANISSSSLTRIYQGKQTPTPEFLKKLSDATNNITYEDYMIAANYWTESDKHFLIGDKNIFPFRLKKTRLEKGMSIEQLSALSGLTIERINDFENGEFTQQAPFEMVGLAKVLNVDSGYLSGEERFRNSNEKKAYFSDLNLLCDNLDKLNEKDKNNITYNLNQILELSYKSSVKGGDFSNYSICNLKTLSAFLQIFHDYTIACSFENNNLDNVIESLLTTHKKLKLNNIHLENLELKHFDKLGISGVFHGSIYDIIIDYVITQNISDLDLFITDFKTKATEILNAHVNNELCKKQDKYKLMQELRVDDYKYTPYGERYIKPMEE